MFALQIGSRSLRLGANRRNEVKQELSAASELLVQFLVSQFSCVILDYVLVFILFSIMHSTVSIVKDMLECGLDQAEQGTNESFDLAQIG